MYKVFSGDIYYPCGGFEDFKGEFESMESAKLYIQSEQTYGGWAQIVKDNQIVLKGCKDAYKNGDEEWHWEVMNS